ncbi:response regulator transcription factor [Microbacterium imperiale]|uniref:response regulator transcription factor n=1 Tax=Microbacterium imperiale TaxID=33884 RepID=UPI001AE64184|nr:response regulator transcription factor [Microbacterium imperiale]MDS0198737.1 response regulator transcription factor [Microbacterium imperiale]
MSLKLLIVEDDPRLGPIMRDVLATDWDVALAGSGEDALAAVETTTFAVMIIDRGLPRTSGLDVIREMRRRRIATPVLILTALGQVHDKVEGLDAGANDYLVKPFDFQELAARLRALTRDDTGVEVGRDIGSWVFYESDLVIESMYGERVSLTETEAALLAVLANEPTRTFSRTQLLARVFAQGESTTTVDTYVHYLRRKTQREIISTVRGRGYRLGDPA